MSHNLTFHSDPGHAWLEVPVRLVALAGLTPYDFSRFSSCRNSTLFLEEDCDAPTFMRAAEAAGVVFTVTERHLDYDHWIRALDRIEAPEPDDYLII